MSYIPVFCVRKPWNVILEDASSRINEWKQEWATLDKKDIYVVKVDEENFSYIEKEFIKRIEVRNENIYVIRRGVTETLCAEIHKFWYKGIISGEVNIPIKYYNDAFNEKKPGNRSIINNLVRKPLSKAQLPLRSRNEISFELAQFICLVAKFIYEKKKELFFDWHKRLYSN